MTLKWTVPPTFTLISVVKPWIVVSPIAESISHVLRGVPGRQFSASIEFAGDVHELAASRTENADTRNVIDATVSIHVATPQSCFFMMKFSFFTFRLKINY